MSSDELFEAVSHPIRIDIVKILAEKPLGFADLKRELKISSSVFLAKRYGCRVVGIDVDPTSLMKAHSSRLPNQRIILKRKQTLR